MRKSVCTGCGLVNLESFPSFPLCEGCGARLPQRKRRPVFDWVQRPVKTLVWAFGMGAGVAILALLSVGIARETRMQDRGALLVASSIVADETGSLLWSLQISPSDPTDHAPINSLRLRINQTSAREADVEVVSPKPSASEKLGNGRYFVWNEFEPAQTITLRLRPRHALLLQFVGRGFTRSEMRLAPR